MEQIKRTAKKTLNIANVIKIIPEQKNNLGMGINYNIF